MDRLRPSATLADKAPNKRRILRAGEGSLPASIRSAESRTGRHQLPLLNPSTRPEQLSTPIPALSEGRS